jgi:hypothetical protein
MIDTMVDELLDAARRPAMTRLHDLMERIDPKDLTPP